MLLPEGLLHLNHVNYRIAYGKNRTDKNRIDEETYFPYHLWTIIADIV